MTGSGGDGGFGLNVDSGSSFCECFFSIDWYVFSRGGLGLVMRRFWVVDVPAELVEVEYIEVVGGLDEVDQVLPELWVVVESLKLVGDDRLRGRPLARRGAAAVRLGSGPGTRRARRFGF